MLSLPGRLSSGISLPRPVGGADLAAEGEGFGSFGGSMADLSLGTGGLTGSGGGMLPLGFDPSP